MGPGIAWTPRTTKTSTQAKAPGQTRIRDRTCKTPNSMVAYPQAAVHNPENVLQLQPRNEKTLIAKWDVEYAIDSTPQYKAAVAMRGSLFIL